MAWVKVPPENHPVFFAALPADPGVETLKMFGGVAAKVNGHLFAALFGRSTMVNLSDTDRAAALALNGASPFDPMGNGRAQSNKVMLPEAMMAAPDQLRAWIARAFEATAVLPKKESGAGPRGGGRNPRQGGARRVAAKARTTAKETAPKARTTAKETAAKGPAKRAHRA